MTIIVDNLYMTTIVLKPVYDNTDSAESYRLHAIRIQATTE